MSKAPTGSKVLRMIVVVDDSVSEDLHQTKPGGVSVGSSYTSDVVVFGSNTPTRHQLFDYRAGRYYLDLPAQARGKLRMGRKVVSAARLRKRYGKGDSCRIALDPRTKGKLRLGQSTLIFQFDTPKPVPPKVPFPAMFKASVLGMIGAIFLYSQLTSLSILGPLFMWATFTDVPEDLEVELEERFLVAMNISRDEKKDEPEEEQEEVEEDDLAEEDEDLVAEKEKPKPVKVLKEKPKNFSKQAIAKARSVGVARTLGTLGGDGPGTVFDNIQNTQNNLGELMNAGMSTTVAANGPVGELGPIGGDGIDLEGSMKGTEGFQTGDGPAMAKKAGKRERKIKGRAKTSKTDVSGGGDKNAIKAAIRYRTSALQHCYNRARRTNDSLAGKMTYTIVVSVMGTVTRVSIDEDSLGSASVSACAKAKIKGWRFPMNGAEEGADVTFTVVFSG